MMREWSFTAEDAAIFALHDAVWPAVQVQISTDLVVGQRKLGAWVAWGVCQTPASRPKGCHYTRAGPTDHKIDNLPQSSTEFHAEPSQW